MLQLFMDNTAEPVAGPGSRLIDAKRFTAQEIKFRQEMIAEEVPVALVYNGMSFVVMLATPMDLEDFAAGFSLTEGIAGNIAGLSDITIEQVEQGIKLHITLSEGRFNMLRRRQRNLAGGSGCGLCGADSFAETLRPLPPIKSTRCLAPEAICQAMAELPARQTLNHDVGAVHAAAFANAEGHILAVREDVGRHNALDKLIGHLARDHIDPGEGFVAVSSRCSYEMVHKTAAAGIPLIASVSAPTAMAVEFAESVQVGIAAFAREGRFTAYAVPSRIGSQS